MHALHHYVNSHALHHNHCYSHIWTITGAPIIIHATVCESVSLISIVASELVLSSWAGVALGKRSQVPYTEVLTQQLQ